MKLGRVQNSTFADSAATLINKATADTMYATDSEPPSDETADLLHEIQRYTQPCIYVNSRGVVCALNEAGERTCQITAGQHLDAAEFLMNDGEALSSYLARRLADHVGSTKLRFLRVYHAKNLQAKLLFILPKTAPNSQRPEALLFFLGPNWLQSVRDQVSQMFGLTATEADILFLFLEGLSLEDITKARNRSLATIRTQFNAIMNKCGHQRQASLMRELLLALNFPSEVKKIERALFHPHRRERLALRPGGRAVEVTLSGDMDGALAVFLTVPGNDTFSPGIEAAFSQNGLCVASLARPGYGRTDPPPSGMSHKTCMIEDFVAVLEQLDAANVTIIASRNSLQDALSISAARPKLVRNILRLDTQPPKRFFAQAKKIYRSSVMPDADRANQESPADLAAVIRSKVAKAMATQKYSRAKTALADDQLSHDLITHLEDQDLLDNASQVSTRWGINSIVANLQKLAMDGSRRFKSYPVKIITLRAANGMTYPFTPVRAVRDGYPEIFTLIEISAGKPFLFMSHIDPLVKQLQAMRDAPIPSNH